MQVCQAPEPEDPKESYRHRVCIPSSEKEQPTSHILRSTDQTAEMHLQAQVKLRRLHLFLPVNLHLLTTQWTMSPIFGIYNLETLRLTYCF